MKLIHLFCCIGTLLAVKSVQGQSYEHYYIQYPCHQNRYVNPGQNGLSRYGFVSADTDDCYNANSQCSIILNATAGHHITIRFQDLSTDYPDTLYVSGETGTSYYFYGFNTPSYSLHSSGNWLKLSFLTYERYGGCLRGFRIYYTTFHYGDCESNEFRCAIDGRCIPNEVKCDSYDNCGDWSDERSGTCGLSTGAIAAISVTCALVGISCLALLFYCLYDRAHRRNSEQRRGSSRGNTTAPITVTEPIGPPKYTDDPPAYVYNNAVYAGVYEELDHSIGIPPAYQSFATTPYDNHHQSFTAQANENSNSHSNSLPTNDNNSSHISGNSVSHS